MYPIWNCPVRQRILRETFSAPDEEECLRLMAVLRLFAVKVKEGVIDDLCSTDYPLPFSRCINDRSRRRIKEARTFWIAEQPTTASIVSIFGIDAKPQTKSHAYWIHLWNTRWKEFGSFSGLSLNTRTDLEVLATRIAGHKDVEIVRPWGDANRLGEGGPVKLEPIPWVWERELQLLPVRAILGLALRGYLSVVTLEATRTRGPIRDCLRQFTAFLAGDGEASAVSIDPRDDYALHSIYRVLEFVTGTDAQDLDTLLVRSSDAVLSASLEDYFALLALDLGEFPELGRPIDIGEDGPLGPVKNPG